MNVLLIHPQMSQNKLQKKTTPMGLAYIAAYCRRELPGLHIEIFDAHALDASMDQVFAKIRERDWNVIGCTAWTVQMPAAQYILSGARKIKPEASIVLGGTHATMLGESAEFASCDYVFLGESEVTFCEMLKSGPKKHKTPQYVKASAFIADLDSLPFPAWDLLPMDKYTFPLHVAKIPRIPMIGSRGCPYNCSFCSSPKIWNREVRYRSPENIVSEILEAKRVYGYEGVHFWDDNFLEDPIHATKLCDGLITRNAGIRWVALTRASLINKYPELLVKLKEAGCIALEIGLEAFDDAIYKTVGKGETKTDILDAVANLKKVGIVPLFTFMTFMPGETLTTAFNLSRFFGEIMPASKKIQAGGVGDWPIVVGQFTTPHVGTSFSVEAGRSGIKLSRDYGDYNHHNINWVPDTFLDDVPVKNGVELDGAMLAKLENKKSMLYTEFGDSPMPEAESDELSRITGILLKQVNGIRTVRQLVESLKFHTGMSENRAYRLGPFVLLCMAQFGVIKSAQAA